MKSISKRSLPLFLALTIVLALLSVGVSAATIVDEQFRSMDNHYSLAVTSISGQHTIETVDYNYLEGYGATQITFNGQTGSLIHLYVTDHTSSSGKVIADGTHLTFDLYVSDVSGIKNIDDGDASCNLIAYSATQNWDLNNYGRIHNQQVRDMYRNLQNGWNHIVLELDDKTTGDMLWALRLYHTGIVIPEGVYMILDDVRLMNAEGVNSVLPHRTAAKNLSFDIADLPEASQLQLSDKAAVDAVANAYDAMDGEYRVLVKNLQKLTDVRAKMAELVDAENNKPPVIPDQTVTFTVGTVKAGKNDLALVDVKLAEEQTAIGSLTLTMEYNAQQLELVPHPDAANGENWMVPGEVLTDCSASWMVGTTRFAAASAEGFAQNGVVFTAAFRVLKEIPEGEIFPISVTVNIIDHCEYYTDKTYNYGVTVIDGGVIAPDDPTAADKAAAAQVTAMINALNVTSINEEAAVTTAREAYDALTDTQKGYVTNLAKLEEAEAKILELKKPPVLYGDVDKDGKVSAIDALEVLKHVVGKTVLTNEAYTAGDVSGNGALEAVDALTILKFVVRKIQVFPVEQ